ncbi:MAG: Unknown protein [uncultured Thiotrichaceae bacterium]|uniref:Cholesterol oxidase n=1 Tax=uncultured Thiotrichaceae bacterium TaxID=298394 RepID=A0A6S6U3U0_9GAMM|nr:MAG: Unknown protein [uncultured Thiotrichaceae bacterium]
MSAQMQFSKGWIAEGLEQCIVEQESHGSQVADFDVIIIGSGYGGAIAAAELAGAKDSEGNTISVCILERGKEFIPGMFPAAEEELPAEVRVTAQGSKRSMGAMDGLFDLRMGPELNVVLGNGLGGGSLINAGVMDRPLKNVFQTGWPRAFTESAKMDAYYDEASELVGSSVGNEPNTILRHNSHQAEPLKKYQSLKELSHLNIENCSFRAAPITVCMQEGELNSADIPLHACTLCGDCATGCNHGAKNSLDTNLLVTAKQRGARIFTGASVIKLDEGENGVWELEVVHTQSSLRIKQGHPYSLRAKKVIVAAGALGSTEILTRSQQQTQLEFSARLGKGFSSNGDMLAVGYKQNQEANTIADEAVEFSKRHVGPTITGMIDRRDPLNKKGLLIEEMSVPAAMKRVFAELYTTANTLHSMENYDTGRHQRAYVKNDPASINQDALKHTSLYAVMGHDDNVSQGRLELQPTSLFPTDNTSKYQEGVIQIHWPELGKEPLFTQQIKTLAEMLKESGVGGKVIANPGWKLLPDSMMSLVDNQVGALTTVHPLGGCSMADDVESGVVDDCGRVFRRMAKQDDPYYSGLYVLDGAIIPSSLGINPALTIAAVSLRAVRCLKKEWGYSDASGEAVVEVPTPRPICNEPPLPKDNQPTEIEVVERLSGDARITDDKGESHDVVIEVTLSFASKKVLDLCRMSAESDHEAEAGRLRTKDNKDTHELERNQIRVYLKKDWETLQRTIYSPEHMNKFGSNLAYLEKEMDKAATFIGDVSGTLDVFTRDKSYFVPRVARVLGYSWLFNRGLRDTWQQMFPKHYEKKPGHGERKEGVLKRIVKPISNSLKLASRAGEKRMLEYALNIDDVRVGKNFRSLKGTSIKGFKVFTYARRANPWWQLAEIYLTDFQGLEKHPTEKKTILRLDTRYLARINVPLLRLSRQSDQYKALMDVMSLGMYVVRLLVSIHLWSFRSPDTPAPHEPKRLPQKITGLPEPEVKMLTVGEIPKNSVDNLTKGMDVKICLTRYPRKNSNKNPVVMLHGYSASGTSFTHNTINKTLVESFWEDDRDVWILDMRTSAGMPTARYPWRFEDVAQNDIPVAFNYIYEMCNNKPVDALVHCMGSVMFSMSVLIPERINFDNAYFNKLPAFDKNMDKSRFYEKRVNAVIYSQVTPMVVFSPGNRFRALLTSYLKELIPQDYHFKPVKEPGLLDQILDRVLYTLPYPRSEFDRENPPYKPWKRVTFARTRHRMDALYGRDFNLQQIDDEVMENIDDLFGPLSIDTVSQAIHFNRQNIITNPYGKNEYVSFENMQNWTFPTCGFHGGSNGLADIATAERTKHFFESAGHDYHIIQHPGKYGHQDSLIGRDAHKDIFKPILRFLRELEDKKAKTGDERVEKVKVVTEAGDVDIEMPWFGPVCYPADQSSKARVLVGIDPILTTAYPPVFIPITRTETGGRAIMDAGGLSLQRVISEYTTVFLNHYRDSNFENFQREHQCFVENYPEYLLPHSTEIDEVLVVLPYLRFPETPAKTGSVDIKAAQGMLKKAICDFVNSEGDISLACIQPYGDKDEQSDTIMVAFGSCQYTHGMLDEELSFKSYHKLSNRLADEKENKPDLLLLMGDQVYTDPTAGLFDPRSNADRFIQPYKRWLSNRFVRDVCRQLPMYSMLDDHEIVDNWEPIAKKAQEVYPEYAADLREKAEYGVRAYLCFQRGKFDQDIQEKSRNDLPKLWYSFQRKGFDFFMMDTRTDRGIRTATAEDGLISQAQCDDLREWLARTTTADHKPRFIVSPSMIMPIRKRMGTNTASNHFLDDGWAGYPSTLAKVLSLLVEHQHQNLVFLSGDEHFHLNVQCEIHQASDKKVSFHSIHSSGLYAPFGFANSSIREFEFMHEYSFADTHSGAEYQCRVTEWEGRASGGFSYLQISKEDGEWIVHNPTTDAIKH